MPAADSKAGLLDEGDEILLLMDVGSCLVMLGGWFERSSIYNRYLPGFLYLRR